MADIPSAASDAAAVRLARRRHAVRQARSHTRRVWWLRRLLPAFAVANLSLYVLLANFTFSVGNLTATIGGVQLASDRVTMLNPKLEGATNDNGIYSVGAARAIQNLATPDVIELETITAELKQLDGRVVTLSAEAGSFQTERQELDMKGQIVVRSSDGMEALLSEADVDVKNQAVVSNKPVYVRLPNGEVRANTLHIDIAGRIMSFRERVRVRLQRREPTPTTAGDNQ